LRELRVKGVPRDDCFLYLALLDWSIQLRAAFVASRNGLRIFQAEFPAYARVCVWLASLFGGSSLLVEHNVEYERLSERLAVDAVNAPAFLRTAEIELCHQADSVVTVSARDRDTLLEAGVAAAKVTVIPHGVETDAFRRLAPSPAILQRHGIPTDRPVLVYHGTYRYPPNLEAIDVLANEVLPRLKATGIDAVVMAVGPDPPTKRPHAGVFFTGSVASVAPYIHNADVAVMPLQHGAGTRMKVMDYFAAGVPVVSTSKGVEGLGLTDGCQLLVRDDWATFADAVASVIRDRERATALAAAGQLYVDGLDWSHVAQRYLDLYAEISRA
jgi:glycosyltransferase involved in cell wall biosynthesis